MRLLSILALSLTLAPPLATPAQLIKFDSPRWEPIADEVYLQEVGAQVQSSEPLTAVAVYQDVVYTGGTSGVARLADESTLEPVAGPEGAIAKLRVLGDGLWAAGPTGLWRFDGAAWTRVTTEPVTDLCAHNGAVVAASGASLFTATKDGLTPLATAQRPLLGLASYGGTIYVHDGARVGLLESGEITYRYIFDWGTLQRGATIRDMLSLGSRLVVATNEGLGVLRGMTWYAVQGEDGLCYEDATCLAEGFERDLWIGTARGAIRNQKDDYQYFAGKRWVPAEQVNAAASGQRAVYLATDGGLGIITYEPFTLAKKAAYYERWMEEWGQKRLGFVHSLNLIDGEWVREVSDNDVGYSSHYMAAKCFEYAATGSEEARAEAVNMMKTVKWSEEITSIDGFPARSIYAVGEPTLKAMHGSGGLPAEWHRTEDGLWEWKGDTSSDETDAQIYETMLFIQLVANDEEKVWATDHLRRLVGHIVDNGYMLRDVDGEPTRWARWDPEYLQSPYGEYARGLNGLGIMNYVTTAAHFTGDAKFAEAKKQVVGWNYQGAILRQKLTFHPGYFTHFDDRLAFYNYFSLIQYETDPELKSMWLRSLERAWEVKRIEAVPWFHFIYGALTGNDNESDRAVEHLRDWPLDLRRHSYRNSHRDDLHTPAGYREYAERPKPLSPRETEPNRWDGDFMQLDGGSNGEVVADPGGWLDAYWMGRYYGMITPPQTGDISLTTVPHRGIQVGAKPYAGPERPKLEHEK